DLKVFILGEANVGKTTLLYRYIEGVFQDQISTIGASFFLKQWGKRHVSLWDTAGEERFSGLSNLYCRGASAVIMAFDVTRPSSFHSLRSRFLPLVEYANHNCLVVVTATKVDLAKDTTPIITMAQGLEFTKTLNKELQLTTVPYFETSSKTGKDVTEVFEYVFRHCFPDENLHKKTPPVHIKSRSSTVDLETQSNDEETMKVGCC
ncbi:unnamed protein product, partial [Owenia fusiformis]